MYALDLGAALNLLNGLLNGNNLQVLLGCIAAILAAWNHGSQIVDRRKKNKQNQPS
jgi:hypothetical protein